MIAFLRRLTQDSTMLLLLIVLFAFGWFIVWQFTRLDENSQPGGNFSATASGVTIAETTAALENTPVSRPRLTMQRWQTTNGARVYFVAAPELPMLDVRVIFDAGSARDGGLSGLGRFTSAMIGEGTKTRSTDDISRGFESLGAQFSTSAWRDMAVAELRTLTRAELMQPALDLFADVLARPSFPKTAIERIKGQMLVGLTRDEEEPGTIASRSFMAALYLNHPYAAPSDGTVATINAIRAEDLKAFHQRHYVARNAVIAMVGAVDRAVAGALAEQLAGALATGDPAPELPVPPNSAGGGFHVKFASKQTHLLIGLPALQRNDPDEAALMVANEILGGGLSSLLTEAVRNERGLAYSIGSSFQGMRVAGPFVVSMQTRNDAAGEALGVALDTLRRFTREGPTPEQLEDARRQLIGGYSRQLAGNRSLVGTLGMMGFYNLSDDYLERQLSRIEQLTREQVRDAFARHVSADRLMIVTLGPEKPVATVSPSPKNAALPAPDATPGPATP